MYFVCIEIRPQNWGKHSGELSGTASFGIVFGHDIRAPYSGKISRERYSGTRPRIFGDIFGHATPNFRRHFRARDPQFSGTRPPCGRWVYLGPSRVSFAIPVLLPYCALLPQGATLIHVGHHCTNHATDMILYIVYFFIVVFALVDWS